MTGLTTRSICLLASFSLLSIPAPQEANKHSASIDEAIALLPQADEERTRPESGVVHPAVQCVEEHLDAGGRLSDEQWKRALLRSQAIRARDRWPLGVPFAVFMDVPAWLSGDIEIRVKPGRPDLSPARAAVGPGGGCGNCAESAWRRARYQELGNLPLGKNEISFEIVVERRPPLNRHLSKTRVEDDAGRPTGILWTGEMQFEVEVVPTLEEILPAVHGETIDSAVRRILDVILFENWRVVVQADRERAPELQTTALTLEIDFLERGSVRETKTLVVFDRPSKLFKESVVWDLPDDAVELSDWSVRIRGRATDALRSWNAVRYWDGELEIPLNAAIRR